MYRRDTAWSTISRVNNLHFTINSIFFKWISNIMAGHELNGAASAFWCICVQVIKSILSMHIFL